MAFKLMDEDIDNGYYTNNPPTLSLEGEIHLNIYDLIIAELELVKENIKNIPCEEITTPIGNYDCCRGAEQERRSNIMIIDHRISALKGKKMINVKEGGLTIKIKGENNGKA